jgi:hypothetical protein
MDSNHLTPPTAESFYDMAWDFETALEGYVAMWRAGVDAERARTATEASAPYPAVPSLDDFHTISDDAATNHEAYLEMWQDGVRAERARVAA